MAADVCWTFITTWPCLEPGEWAQSSITGIGLLIAIGVPAWQRRQQRRDQIRMDDNKRRSMAQALTAPLAWLMASSETIIRMLDLTDVQQRDMNINLIGADFLVTPREFDQFRTELHLFGETGRKLNYLLGCAHGVRAFVMEHQRVRNPIDARELRQTRFEAQQVLDFGRQCLEEFSKLTGYIQDPNFHSRPE